MDTPYLAWKIYLDLGWLFLLSLLLMYFWYTRRQAVKAQNTWHKTKAQIIRCEWAKQGPRLWPKIQYRYQVDGQDYLSEHLFFDTRHQSPNSQRARQLAYYVANAFKNNEEIEIYYNPEKPEQAVINIRIPWKLNLIISLLAALIALHLAIITIQTV